MKKQYWTISEVSKVMGVTTIGIGKWEKDIGIKLHTKRNRRNQRIFNRKDYAFMLCLQRMRLRGISIKSAVILLRDGRI